MPRALTLIRHGLTEWNVAGRFQGQTDMPLSEDGRRQARRLARRTPRFGPVELLVASPLARARETAELAFPGRAPVLEPRLMELDFGDFEGRTGAENAATDAWATWAEDPYLRAAPGGESYRALRERAVAWYEALPAGAEHVVAVTHSGTIQMLLAHVLGVEHPRWRKRIYVRHSSVSRIVARGDEVVVERVNDTRHLDENGADPFWE